MYPNRNSSKRKEILSYRCSFDCSTIKTWPPKPRARVRKYALSTTHALEDRRLTGRDSHEKRPSNTHLIIRAVGRTGGINDAAVISSSEGPNLHRQPALPTLQPISTGT